MKRPGRLVLLHLPILVALSITIVFSSESALFRPLRTERTFAWCVVVFFPLAALLSLVQLGIWLVWARRWLAAR